MTKPPVKYSPEEVDRALTALAYSAGNMDKARRLLKDEGHEPPDVITLRRWRERFADRYADIRREAQPKMAGQLAEVHADLARNLAEMESRAVELLDDRLDIMSGRELAQAIKAVSAASAIHTDKMRLLRGEATHIVRRELPEVMRALEAKGLVIEGTAEEVDGPLELPTGPDDPPA